MVIPKLIGTKYFTKSAMYPPVTGKVDRLVFIIKRASGSFSYRMFDLHGDLSLHDKILASIGQNGNFLTYNGSIEGPFYIGSLQEAEVNFPEWETTKEFFELMDYEFLRRRPYSIKVDNDGIVEELEGRAIDWEEFKHLYVNERYFNEAISFERS